MAEIIPPLSCWNWHNRVRRRLGDRRLAAVRRRACRRSRRATACARRCRRRRTRWRSRSTATSPRLLETSQEIAVPVTVANTGGRAWDPARIHLSYHWLWLVPRELAHRSRTVPYHDGIRTDLGARRCRRARSVALAGAPPCAGAARSLLAAVGHGGGGRDLVRAGGAATAAHARPRRCRRRRGLFAPLPLLVALWGLLRRAARIAAGRGVWPSPSWRWRRRRAVVRRHAGSETADPRARALLEPTAVAYWLILAVAVLVPLARRCCILPRRVRPWVLLAIGIFGSLLILADVVYYRFFGDVLSTPAMLAAHQTGHVWGSIGSLFTPGLLWLIVDWPFAVWLAVRMSRRRAGRRTRRWRRAIATGGARGCWRSPALSLSACRACSRRPRSIRCSAPARSSNSSDRSAITPTTPGTTRAARWLRRAGDRRRRSTTPRRGSRARAAARGRRPRFGAARGRNLIVVQVESLQDFVVDFTVGGQEVMPHLRRWTADSLRFTNVTDQTSEGRTSDAEFTTMTSLLPLDHGAVAFRFPGNHYAALPRVLTEHGYATLSAVAVRARILEPAGDAPGVRVPAEPVRARLPDDGADRLGAERSRLPAADGAAARAAAAAVRRLADHAVAAPSVRVVSRSAQGAEARRARRHVVRQLPAHDAFLRSGARGVQGGAGARRPARRQPARGVRRSRRRLRPRRVAGADDRHRRRRCVVDAERSHAAVHARGGQAGEQAASADGGPC